jgi:hypothetical protein
MALNATDRCDRCMAQAVASADSLNWATTLLFCAHHLSEHLPELTRLGVLIMDDRDERAVTP